MLNIFFQFLYKLPDDPQKPAILYLIARSYEGMKNYNLARRYYKRVMNIEPEISSKNILIAAHGNSLRALVKHLENISEQEIVQLEIATGVPIIYKFSDGSYTKQ